MNHIKLKRGSNKLKHSISPNCKITVIQRIISSKEDYQALQNEGYVKKFEIIRFKGFQVIVPMNFLVKIIRFIIVIYY